VYLLEAGLVLLVAPWSVFWERNLVVELFPRLGEMMLSPSVRGAVSGFGLVNVVAGMAELGVALGAWIRRRRGGEPTQQSGTSATPAAREGEPPWIER